MSFCIAPLCIWTNRARLVGPHIVSINGSHYEILRWNWGPEDSAQHGQLTNVRHGISKRTLEHSLWGRVSEWGLLFQVGLETLKHGIELPDIFLKIILFFGLPLTANEECTGVPENTRHMENDLMGGSGTRCRTKTRKTRRRVL
jgi:hypothetical protein